MMVLLSLLVATLPLAAAAPIAQLSAGHQAYRAGQYQKAARLLAGLPAKLPRTRDYALYFAAESEFYAGRLARARALFDQLADERDSRFAALAPWRVADCLWAEGRKAEAAAAYRKLLADYPNLYGDMSANSCNNAMSRDLEFTAEFLKRHQDKLFFGSDCGCSDGHGGGVSQNNNPAAARMTGKCVARETLSLLKRSASRDIFHKVVWGNAHKLLQIPA
jgi:tetratricopeptide (TPR) repeat protein